MAAVIDAFLFNCFVHCYDGFANLGFTNGITIMTPETLLHARIWSKDEVEKSLYPPGE